MSIEHAKQLKLQLERSTPEEVCGALLGKVAVTACASNDVYSDYKTHVQEVIGGNIEAVFIAGSGNWGFSLSPDKQYRTFCEASDIDLCLVSRSLFDEVWSEIRTYHRKNFYRIGHYAQTALRRNGENVYSGFVSPLWIGDKAHRMRNDFELKLNAVSSKHVGFKSVNAFVFKNQDEAVDYYKRGMVALLKDKKV
jgi:hypothetical protein